MYERRKVNTEEGKHIKVACCSYYLLFCFILLFIQIPQTYAGVAAPVKPCFNHSQFYQFFKAPLIPDDIADIEEFAKRGGVGYHKNALMMGTDRPTHSKNKVYGGVDPKVLVNETNYFPGTTYWMNDYLHVGHVHYDICLLQVFSMIKIDRIIMQRAVCHGILCAGIGTVESFYKGYFTALVEAFNQTHVPVYLRYQWRELSVSPIYFDSKSPTFYQEPPKVITKASERKYAPIKLQKSHGFERLLRRADYKFGDIPSVSPKAVKIFKAAAYKMLDGFDTGYPKLKPEFDSLKPPYNILFSYRGPMASSRKIVNQDEFVAQIRKTFPAPTYVLRTLNNSDPNLDFKTQIAAVGSAHVVITSHGAFEGNMIYMKNSSLLIELFGEYGNNEVHTFHRLALMFGLYYARLNPQNMTDHLQSSYVLADKEMDEVFGIMKEYFDNKHFRHNVLV